MDTTASQLISPETIQRLAPATMAAALPIDRLPSATLHSMFVSAKPGQVPTPEGVLAVFPDGSLPILQQPCTMLQRLQPLIEVSDHLAQVSCEGSTL